MTMPPRAKRPLLVLAVLVSQLAPLFSARTSPAQESRAARAAADESADSRAFEQIFGDQHWKDLALDVHRRAQALDAESRYRFLSQWVLPERGYGGFRLAIDFVPADQSQIDGPQAVAASGPPASLQNHPAPSAIDPLPGHGGRMVSPALDLVDVAAELGRIASLRDTVARSTPSTANGILDQLALRTLLAMKEGDQTTATSLLDQLMSRYLTEPQAAEASRDAVLMCLHRALDSPELASVAFEPAQRVLQRYLDVYDRDAWHRHLWMTVASLQEIVQRDESAAPVLAGASTRGGQQWHSVIRSRAFEHGNGFPPPQWKVDPGTVKNLSSHGDDFLFFALPLQGHYDLQADVTGFAWRDSHLMTAGTWVAPVYDHVSYGLGSLRGEQARLPLDPPLTDTHSFGTIHYRTSVTDSQAKTFFNGRLIHTQNLGSSHDPWVAIRSSYRHDGGANDLRIAGSPTIPDSIFLSESVNLPGWFEYYQIPVRDELVEWQHEIQRDAKTGTMRGEITGRQNTALPFGSDAESLLVYARPMLEDGSIEYEFWYEPDRFAAHPALGRHCFLLSPGGVQVHPLTDGKYDRTSARPGERLAERQNPQGPPPMPMPLLIDSWNRVALSVRGDRFVLALNGQQVYECQLDKGGQRTFGLFRYADREQTRVRGVRWTGDWLKQLPAVKDQQLASIEPALLEENSQSLTSEFSHVFDETTFTSRRFNVISGDAVNHFQATAEGVVVNRPAETGYRNASISPNIEVGGDFDVTISFDQLEIESLPNNSGTVQVEVSSDNEQKDVGSLQRRRDLVGDPMVQCLHMQTIAGTERRHYFDRRLVEATAGRLRLSRRGDRLFYCLAENDSDQFRQIGQSKFSIADIQTHGIRFSAQIQGTEGFTRVRWKEAQVRAERMQGAAFEDLDAKLAGLNQQREQLKASIRFDFKKEPPSPRDFYRWTDLRQWDAADNGLIIEAAGADTFTSAGISLAHPIDGDVDATIEFDPFQIAIPAAGQESSVFLQLHFGGRDQMQVTSMLSRTPDGSLISKAQLRSPNAAGGFDYKVLSVIDGSSITRLRLARRAGRVYFIAGSGDNHEVIVAHAEVNTLPIVRSGLLALLHTGGEGRTSKMLLKSLDLKAAQVPGFDTQPVLNQPLPARLPQNRPPVEKPKSFLRSILDLF